jgi:hypothetical protein
MEWGYFIVIFPKRLFKGCSIGGLHPTTFVTAFIALALYAYAVHMLAGYCCSLKSWSTRIKKGIMVWSYPPVFVRDAVSKRSLLFRYLYISWEFSVWFERLQVWNVSCGCKYPKSTSGDTCFAYLQMKYSSGPVTLFWNQLWRVTFKINLTLYVRWASYVTSFGFTFSSTCCVLE